MSKDKLTQIKHFFDFEKELAYLNEMNRLGWKLERLKLGCVYSFSKTEPEEYTTLIYAENRSRLEETAALAHRCGFEQIPHRFDGMQRLLYLTGRHDEVSPVFYNDSESIIRAQRIMFKRYFVLSVVLPLICAALIAESVLLFIVPLISSGKAPGELPLFFALTAVFSALTLVFCVFTAFAAGSAFKVRKRLEELLRQEDEKKEKKAAAKEASPDDDNPVHERRPELRAIDITKK